MGTAKKTWVTGEKVIATDINGNFEGHKETLTSGATINGATTPVPVMLVDADNEVYPCDADDNTRYKFDGFAITNGTNGNDIDVQDTGAVTGFSGLTEGARYYVSNTAGSISTTPGDKQILVGIAISTTEILILRSPIVASGTHTFSSTATSSITTGFRPKLVIIMSGGEAAKNGFSHGSSDGTNNISAGVNDADGNFVDGSNSWHFADGSGDHGGVCDTFSETGFRLNNTKTGTPANISLHWVAFE